MTNAMYGLRTLNEPFLFVSVLVDGVAVDADVEGVVFSVAFETGAVVFAVDRDADRDDEVLFAVDFFAVLDDEDAVVDFFVVRLVAIVNIIN